MDQWINIINPKWSQRFCLLPAVPAISTFQKSPAMGRYLNRPMWFLLLQAGTNIFGHMLPHWRTKTWCERTRTLRRFKGKPTGFLRKSHLGISMRTGLALFNVFYVCFFNGAAGLLPHLRLKSLVSSIFPAFLSSAPSCCNSLRLTFLISTVFATSWSQNLLFPQYLPHFWSWTLQNFAELCSSNLWLGPICLQRVRSEISSLQGTCSVVFLNSFARCPLSMVCCIMLSIKLLSVANIKHHRETLRWFLGGWKQLAQRALELSMFWCRWCCWQGVELRGAALLPMALGHILCAILALKSFMLPWCHGLLMGGGRVICIKYLSRVKATEAAFFLEKIPLLPMR